MIEKLNEMSTPMAVTLMMLIVSSIMYFLYRSISSELQERLKPLAKELNCEIKAFFSIIDTCNVYINVLDYGNEMHLRLIPQRASRRDLVLELLKPLGFQFTIIEKQGFMFSLWRKEVKINNLILNTEYLIRADKPSEAESYLMHPKRIDAIKFFFENDFKEIKANAKRVYLIKKRCAIKDLDKDLTLEKVRTYLDYLNSFNII